VQASAKAHRVKSDLKT